MQKQTPKWLDLFLTAFGPSGLVALAWWAGAFHAQRIRELQLTYPILNITGNAGVGKSTLVANLWKLVGSSDAENRNLHTCSMGALLAILARAVNRPVVLEENRFGHDGYDWNSLSECYSGGTIARRTSDPVVAGVRFQGALAFVGGELETINRRIVNIHLKWQPRTADNNRAIQALYDLHIGDFSEFLVKVQENREQLMYRLGHVGAYVQSLQDETDNGLTPDAARNHAQLRVLVDFLADLFPMADDRNAQHDAHALISDMAWSHIAMAKAVPNHY
ncbi:hypothetical protein [Pseudomonas aeruginosa]|uniref:hypothetical protein n=1 Tax=Pseudomonas aeruginosa TaxID=287 RepID=UPI000E31452D|nr:hypothetical protein [Pseudomonas aeruginosa]NPY77796.1 hypothetical protein [Pseudomonas aeruginosa]TQF95949.1 hypothetical protein FLO05_02645 [Pseudomonas aeruginosa]TQG11899.1 hypothetical protein FLN16_00200 [Pseudomonas aeruginosa]TQG13171.1 hypothetical protein FLN37_15465 [Pseudomonas aeruginosa]TQG24056.1 hypothetical protein FLI79_17550 [Pseudomonas aeruginosa]